MNGRLGDFGLARLYDHGTGPQTTHVVGTLGYIAPELYQTGKGDGDGDSRREIGGKYTVEEVELVLKLGLLCTHVIPSARPSMRQVMQFLDRDVELPDLSPDYMNVGKPHMEGYQGFNDFFVSYATSSDQAFFHSSTDEMSVLSG
ncbi:L-type lectin-domain containing receptor kinase IV.1 [Acorus calamus]|uniref:L-type lectin-domain containing receptor kinase IV.1 n=1 Tax=Acorus calamus TaxID=4465 RepID=A0AAV9DG19_ACOCL|nr:L-type lectin-domain containing receptor kinase IV.1 [Acorus calamus]